MHPMGIRRFPRWLQEVILATRAPKRHHKRRRPPRHATIEPCERRTLLSDTCTILGTGSGDDHVEFKREGGNYPLTLVYSVDGGTNWSAVPKVQLGIAVTKVRIIGGEGNDTVTLNLGDGALANDQFAPKIEFYGGTDLNRLLVMNTASGTAGNDAISFRPTDSFAFPTNSFVIDGPENDTLVNFDSNVEPPEFELRGESNSITVEGNSNHEQVVTWNDTLFDPDPARNSNLSLTVNAKGKVVFEDSATLSALEIQGTSSVGGVVALRHSGSGPATKLTTASLTIDTAGNAVLDLSNNALDVHYTGGSPAAILRGYLRSGMGDPRNGAPCYGTGNWDGAAGINSSAAEGNFPAALGYVDDATNEVVRVRFGVYGDANLDGRVDITDLGLLATNWQSSSSWAGGEFNYDGIIDESDLRLLSMTWQSGVSPFGLSRKTSSLYSARAVDRELEGEDLLL